MKPSRRSHSERRALGPPCLHRRDQPGGSLIRCFAALSTLLLAAPLALAASRDELLRLVPEDVGFCLVVQDLRHYSEAFTGSSFIRQFRASPVGVALLKSAEVQKLSEVDQRLRKHLQIDWAHLRDDLLGDAVVLAYRPGPPGKHEQEQGILLVRARRAELLAKFLERVHDAQKKSGELEVLEVRKHNGVEYSCARGRRGTHFYYVHGPVLALTSQEDMLRRVIDLDREARAEGPVTAQLRRLGVENDLVVLWINPRTFQPEIGQKASQARGTEAAVLQTLLAYWKPLEGVACSAALEKTELQFKVSILARQDEVPAALRRLFTAEDRPSELWQRFPDGALFAMAGRVDAVALTDLLADFLPPEARKGLRAAVDRGAAAVLGKDVGKEVLPYLGPDWGLCITAPGAEDKGWFPHVLGVLRVRPGADAPPLDRALFDALNTLAVWAVLNYNNDHADPMSLKTELQDKIEVKYLSNEAFPPGLQPAFALKDGYLVLASTPQVIRHFSAPALPNPGITPADEIPMLRLSLRSLAGFLKERHQALAEQVAQKQQISEAEAGRRLDGFIAGCQLLERLELSQRSVAGRVTFVLRIQTAQPLQK